MKIFGRRILLKFRRATIGDSINLSKIHAEHNKTYSGLEYPKSEEKYRSEIFRSGKLGSSIVVAEDENENIIGFIENFVGKRAYAKIGYPIVDLKHPSAEIVQKELIKKSMKNLKNNGVQIVTTEFVSDERSYRIFKKSGFSHSKVVLQMYQGVISPDYDLDIQPFTIRSVEKQDLDITYELIRLQLDMDSRLFISKKQYVRVYNAQSPEDSGWAVATRDGKIVGVIFSLIEELTNQIVIFGPFADNKNEASRIPLLNELLVYYRLKGYYDQRMFRIRPFSNDKEIFKKYGLNLDEEILYMSKRL